jgi:hypothetical protein
LLFTDNKKSIKQKYYILFEGWTPKQTSVDNKKFALLLKLALTEPPIALGVALLVEGIVLPSIEAWAKGCCSTSQGDRAINASKKRCFH